MNSIFAALVNGAILSTLVTLAVWVGLRLAPRRALNAATRYGVWWAALACTMVLPLLYLPALSHRAELTSSRAEAAPSPAVSGLTFQHADSPLSSAAGAGLAARGPLPRSVPWFPLEIAAGSWPRWIFGTWALLATLMLMRLLASYVLLVGRKKRATDAPPHLAERVGDWMARCGCFGRPVRVAVSSEISTPILAGLRRPSILIPAHLMDELEVGEIDQIGLHEVAHLARGDDYALIVQRVAEALFVLHPVVRWIGRALDLEREIACDDFVLNATGQARTYAACLTRVVELTGGVRGSLTAAAVAESRSHLSRRVDMLLDGARHTGTRLLKIRLAAAVAVVAVLAGTAGQAPGLVAFAQPAVPAPPAVAPVEQAPAVPDPPVPVPVESPAPLPVPAPEPLPRPKPEPQPDPVPQSDPQLVRIAISVQDPQNRYVTGLTQENFRVLEDGVPQPIAAFSNQAVPMSIGILFDTSGSMRTRLPEAQKAVAEFLRLAPPASQSFLITYNDSALLAEGFTSIASQVQSKLDLVQPTGGTALREAIVLALQQMQNAPNPTKALLIVSDGGPDNSSRHSADQVADALSGTNVQVFAISFPAPGVNDRRSLAYLDQITALTGGHHYVAAGEGPLPATAAIALRNLYLIDYRSTNAAHDGQFRKLKVEVLAPAGLPPLKVNHVAGYYATPSGH